MEQYLIDKRNNDDNQSNQNIIGMSLLNHTKKLENTLLNNKFESPSKHELSTRNTLTYWQPNSFKKENLHFSNAKLSPNIIESINNIYTYSEEQIYHSYKYYDHDIVNLIEANKEKNIYFDEIFRKNEEHIPYEVDENNIDDNDNIKNNSYSIHNHQNHIFYDKRHENFSKKNGRTFIMDIAIEYIDNLKSKKARLFTNLYETSELNRLNYGNYKRIIRKINEEFWDAAEKGHLHQVEILLDERKQIYPAEIDSKLLDDWTALHLAANEGHEDICQYLLLKQADIEAKTTMLRTPLHIATLKGNLNIVKLLVDSGANINAFDKDFNTPLHFASEHGYTEIIKFLLRKKPNLDIKNHAGFTPIDVSLNNEVRMVFELNGIPNLELSHCFGRVSVDRIVLFSSRADMISALLFKINKTLVIDNNQKPIPILSKATAKNSYKLYGRAHKPTFSALLTGSFTESKIKRISINPECSDFDGKVGPQSFQCLYMLGKGSFGEVYLVQKISSKKLYAMKILNKKFIIKHNFTKYAKAERNVLSIMNHPFIVRLNFAFQTDTKLYLILDYCPGGDLGSLLSKKGGIKEKVARIYAAEILLALEALHNNQIIFRDLKPDNVVLDSQGHALLTDFGLSKEGVDINLTRSFCGSIAYLAPEILKKVGHNRTVDWYLFGVLIYEMVVGTPPYFNSNKQILFENIEKGDLIIPRFFSKELKDLVVQLLRRDPDKRLGAISDADEIKAHPWFKDINWNDVLQKKLKPPKPSIREFESPLLISQIPDQLSLESQTTNYFSDWSFAVNEQKPNSIL